MTNKIAIILSSLNQYEVENKIVLVMMMMITTILPTRLAVKMVEFVHGMPVQDKERVVADIKHHQEDFMSRQQYYSDCYMEDPHYTRTDEAQDVYEEYYMNHKIQADRPRNQLRLYKRYAKQLENKIKQLEEQLNCR